MGHAEYCRQFIPRGGKVLDVGSGRGDFLREMRGLGFDAYGVEINPERIFEKVVRANAERLPFPDSHFDFVNCAEVTEHVESPEKVCQEIFRVLKPGGKCYISFHNRFGIYDYHCRLYFINWMPRFLAERFLKLVGKERVDGQSGRQRLASMHYYIYRSARYLLKRNGFLAQDIRVAKIKVHFGVLSRWALAVYLFLLRPFYFNTFHFLAEKLKI